MASDETVLVIASDRYRREEFASHVSKAIPNSKITKLGSGLSSLHGQDELVNEITDSEGYALIIQHCGSTNYEFGEFVSSYRELEASKQWSPAMIILFSGSPNSVTQADRRFAGDPFVCAISQSIVERNIGLFLRAFESQEVKQSKVVPWHILRGYGEREYPLQLLSALLPFGVMWEFSGEAGSRKGLKTASERLSIDLFRGTERIIAERVKALSAIEPKDYQSSIPGNANHATAFIDRLIDKKVKTSASAKELETLASAVCGRTDLNLDSALQVLTSSASLRNWNRRLSLLRDCLLD